MGLIRFLQHHMLQCPSKALLHIECPGCGMQRSLLLLAQGRMGDSLAMHPAAIPLLALFCFAVLHLVFRFRRGAGIIIFLQGLVGIVTAGFYIYKIAHHQIFIS